MVAQSAQIRHWRVLPERSSFQLAPDTAAMLCCDVLCRLRHCGPPARASWPRLAAGMPSMHTSRRWGRGGKHGWLALGGRAGPVGIQSGGGVQGAGRAGGFERAGVGACLCHPSSVAAWVGRPLGAAPCGPAVLHPAHAARGEPCSAAAHRCVPSALMLLFQRGG